MLSRSTALLLEGHVKEWMQTLDELDRVGSDNLKDSVDALRKSYYEHLEKAKKDNPDNKYV